MNFNLITKFALAALLLGFSAVGIANAQDPQSDPKMAEMMKKWEEMATPGEQHKILDPLVGSWTTNSKWWMEGPDKPAMESKGSSEVRWIFGGRFLEEKYSGEMMGKPFEGVGYFGYDKFNNIYQGFWMDNSSTAMFPMEGMYNPKDKMLIFPIKMDDPATGEKDKPGLFIYRLVSSDKHVFEMYDGQKLDPQMKTAEIVYTKK
jgi:hypothetical protein